MASIPKTRKLELVVSAAKRKKEEHKCDRCEFQRRLENVKVCLRAALLAAEPIERGEST